MERAVQYEVNFGTVNFGPLGRPPSAAAAGRKFRLALLGDFSGRANAGLAETGEALARRKPVKVDVDTLDDVMARMKLSLALSLDGEEAVVSVPVAAIDDFHPDQIVDAVPLFASLRDLRRNLASKAGFERAAKQVLSWSGEAPLPPPPRRAAGAAVATDLRLGDFAKLSDFARLTGRPGVAEVADQSVDALLRRLVGPFVQPARDARQEQLTARVDEALSATMRRILHHPDFQAAESLWRGVEFLVRRIETGAAMEIVLYDVSAEELAADIAATDQLDQTGLYGLLAEQPALDAHQGPLSAVIGLYGFELMPPHADLLGRIAQVAAACGAPFIAAIAPDPLKQPLHEQHPLIREAWTALRELPQAAYLGLATPRFLLRLPYGRKTDSIDAFGFEEFTRQDGLSGMLWGHPALIPALLLAETFAKGGLKPGAKTKLGSAMTVGDMAYYVYAGPDGDAVALPCTERLYTEKQSVAVSNYGVMPLLSLRGRPELRLGGFASLAGQPIAGFWAPVVIAPKPAAKPTPAEPTPVTPDPATPDPATPDPATPDPATPDPATPEPPAQPQAVLPSESPAEPPAEPEPSSPPSAELDPAATPVQAEAATDTSELDALLAGLAAVPDAAPAAADAPSAEDELDALLASLNAEPPPPEPDATEADLDALLASLN